jgi:hypothetical protein
MLRVERRIEKLEDTLGISDRVRPFVHRISFIDGEGKLAGILVMSDDPKLCVPYETIEKNQGGV